MTDATPRPVSPAAYKSREGRGCSCCPADDQTDRATPPENTEEVDSGCDTVRVEMA